MSRREVVLLVLVVAVVAGVVGGAVGFAAAEAAAPASPTPMMDGSMMDGSMMSGGMSRREHDRRMERMMRHPGEMEAMHRSLSPAERERAHEDCRAMMGLDEPETSAG